jgi:undecaprenyl-diphosphatase
MRRYAAILDARDRALFERWVFDVDVPRRVRRVWGVLTHLGGPVATIGAALAPLLFAGPLLRDAAGAAALTLAISHGIVHVVKRGLLRARPALAMAGRAHAAVPDDFSFPSGHSAAAMSVMLTYALAFPAFASSLLLLATLVGISRVRLGVHYPGDVFAGQVIAIISAFLVRAAWW